YLTVCNSLNHGAGAVYHVAGSKDARSGGMSGLIGYQKAFVIGFQSLGGADDPVPWTLADRDDHAVCLVKLVCAGNLCEISVLVLIKVTEDYAVIFNLNRLFIVLKFHAFQLGIAEFVVAGSYLLGHGEAGQIAHAFSKSGSGHIHGCISRADDDHPL